MLRRVVLLFTMLCLAASGMGLALPGVGLGNVAYASGTVYYLDPGGNDANDGLSLATPWKTLNKARLVLSAGDTLLLRGGSYPANWFSPVNSGTPGNPITLMAYNNEIPVITGDPTYSTYFKFDYVDHIVIDGLHFEDTTGGTVIFTTDSDYITIRNSVFRHHGGDTQVNLSGAYNVVENNVFDTAGDPLGDGGQGAGDNLYLRGISYTIIQNNTFTKGGHYAVDIIDAYDETQPDFKRFSHHNIIRNNTIDQGWGGGIGLIRGTSNTLVENNVIKNAGVAATYPKTGIQLAAENNIIRNNVISKSGSETKADSGMSVSSYRFNGIDQNVVNNRVYNNVIYKSGKEPMAFSQRGATQLKENKFVNNIIYQNRQTGDYNPYWPAGNYYFTFETYHAFAENKWPFFPNSNHIYNNVIAHADALGDKPGEKLFFYDQGDQLPVCYCNGWSKTLAEAQTDYSAFIHGNIEQNPLYTNAEADDFSLQAGSPAIDAGARLAATTAAGTNTTTVPVDDAFFFFDGYGVVHGDLIKIGSNAPVRITNADTSANTLTVSAPVSFGAGDYVDLPYNGAAPDMGLLEYAGQPEPSEPAPPILFPPSAGDGQVTLNWSGVNGADGYRVKFGTESGNYSTTVDAGDARNKTITGLSNGTAYYFVVSAYNSHGESPNSVERSATPLQAAGPAAPVQYDPTTGDGQVTVNWSAVSGADGYRVKYGTSSGGYTVTVDAGNATSRVITGLTNGTTYYFAVTAYNASGESAVSSEKSAVPQQVSAGSGGVTLKNGTNGYSGSASFHVSGQEPTTHHSQDSYHHVINPLSGTNGYVYRPFYRFDVSPAVSGIPVNQQIESAVLKIFVSYVTGEGDPTVSLHRVAPVNEAFAVNYGAATRDTYDGVNPWTGGANAGGNAADPNNDFLDVPDAQATLPPDGDQASFITFDVTSSVQAWINGTPNNGWLLLSGGKTAYLGTAGDLHGASQYPELTVTFAGGVLAAPVLNTAAAGDGQVNLNWSAVSGADGYKIKYGTASGDFTTVVDAGNATNRTISGLVNGTAYYFVVAAYHANGESAASNEKSAVPQGPAAPRATTYYLDPNGNDSNNGSSPDTPWRTLNKAAQMLVAGDTLQMRGGAYPNNLFMPSGSGEAGKPITVKAYNNEVPVITGDPTYAVFIKLDDKSHFVFDGLHFENTTGGTPIFTVRSDYITIRNCVFRNNGGDTQVNLYGAHNVVENDVFDTTGDPLGDGGQGAGDNIYLRGASYTIIQNNTFTRAGHYAVDIIDAAEDHVYSHHNIVRNNTIDQQWGGGIGLIRGSSQTLVENNTIKNAGVGAVSYPKTGLQLAAEKNIIRNNLILNTGSETKKDVGMSVSSYRFAGIDQNVLDNRVYNNVIYKSGKEAIFFTQRDSTQLTRNKFVNNIMYYNRVGGDYNEYWPAGNFYIMTETYHAAAGNKWPAYPNNNQMYNNIILHGDANGDYPGYSPLFYYDQGDLLPIDYRNNGWGKSLAQVQSDYGPSIHSNLERNPGFADANAGDFSLKPGSAAIDAGANLAQTTGTGTNTTTVTVDDPWFFFDGYGIVDGDMVKIGSNAPVRVTNVDTANLTLTVAAPVSFSAGDKVNLPYQGSAPDIGAKEAPHIPVPPAAPVQKTPGGGNGQVTVKWTAVDGADGYKIKYGTVKGVYTVTVDAGNVTSMKITGLAKGTYYFVVTAYNADGESANSNEKKKHVGGGNNGNSAGSDEDENDDQNQNKNDNGDGNGGNN